MERLGTAIENERVLELKDWSQGTGASYLVTAAVAATERGAGARPSIYTGVGVNELFCNSKIE